MTASNMNQPRITGIRFVEFGYEKAIQVDFSNDRHWQAVVAMPHGSEQVWDALMQLALGIKRDPYLREDTT